MRLIVTEEQARELAKVVEAIHREEAQHHRLSQARRAGTATLVLTTGDEADREALTEGRG